MRIMITSEALPVLLALLSSHKDSILMKRVRQFQIQTVINANIVPPLNIASLSCSPIIRILSYPSISFQMFLIFINIQIVCPPSNTSSHCLQINGKFFGFSCDIPLLCPIHPSSLWYYPIHQDHSKCFWSFINLKIVFHHQILPATARQ